VIQLRPYQKQAINACYDYMRQSTGNGCLVLPTGCHAAGHPILMYDGTIKAVEDIVVGDLLMGPDSKPRNVLSLHRGNGDMFRLTPTKGESFIVNADHILSLVCTPEGKYDYPCRRRGGEIDNISLREYLTKSKSWKHLRKLYRIEVEFPYQRDLPIPPYILGLLIGDGSIRDGVEITSIDDEVAQTIINYAESIGYGIRIDDNNRCPSYHLIYEKGKENIITRILTQLELAGHDSGSKFIPHDYLTSSKNDRLSLLAGLMDTDGHHCRSGYDYITQSKELASDVVFLARSLGLAAYCRTKYCYCQNGKGGLYYRICISGDCHNIPCRIPRKKAPNRRQKKSVLRTGFTVDQVACGAFYGFELDSDKLYVDGHFIVHHNSGKSVVLAQICHDAVSLWDGRVLVLAHVQELIEQNASKIKHFLGDNFVGIYSAGLKQKDMHQPVIAASIQSIYKKAFEFEPFDLIIIDEAHLIATSGEGMYLSFLRDAKIVNPNIRIVGTTATPYRTGTGMICGPDNILNEICFEVGIKELIRDGYLCPLRSKASKTRVDTSGLHIRGGEFISNELEDLMDTDARVKAACLEILEYTQDRHAVLIFAAGVEHGKHIQRIFQENHNIECGFVSGDSPDGWRKKMIEDFRGGKLKYLCNVNVLTTGFDAPNIDCIAMLRPTMSPGLYYQMVGRGFRLHERKNDCLVLDFGGNILRHGPVDCLRVTDKMVKGNGDAPAKECPGCFEIIHAAYTRCPACGYEFPPPEKTKHETTASTEGILSDQTSVSEYEVQEVLYSVHTKKGAKTESPRTMRVQYKIGFGSYISEWICFEHTGFARHKAEVWWKQRSSDSIPDDSEMAVFFATNGRLREPIKIIVKHIAGQKFDQITGYQFEDPEANNWQCDQPEPQYVPTEDEIPF